MKDRALRVKDTALDRRMLAKEVGALTDDGNYTELECADVKAVYGSEAPWRDHFDALRTQISREDEIIDRRLRWGLAINSLLVILGVGLLKVDGFDPRLQSILWIVLAAVGGWNSRILFLGLRYANESIGETIRESMRIPPKIRFVLPHTFWNRPSFAGGQSQHLGSVCIAFWLLVAVAAVIRLVQGS
ncbi:MAG: hypothetical protein AAFU73_19905 [Planctomycetota bacterium]